MSTALRTWIGLGVVVGLLGTAGSAAARDLPGEEHAQNQLYAPAGATMSASELRALRLRSEALNRMYGVDQGTSRPPLGRNAPTSMTAAVRADGFEWATLAIGVGTGFGLGLLVVGASAVAARRRATSAVTR